jgi:MarR family transcriptional regulator, transcriptional regulator for hemolysin
MPGSKNTEKVSQFRLGFLVHDVARLRRTVLDKALKPMGITRSQWWVLANLSRNSGQSMVQTELANVMDIGKVALGGLLDRLEANGFIVRTADPVDRRAKRIEMTAKGAAHLKGIQDCATGINDEMMLGVTTEELHMTEDVLHRLKKRLIEMDGEIKNGD